MMKIIYFVVINIYMKLLLDMFAVIKNPVEGAAYATLDAAKEAGAVTINYGLFINAMVTFVIVAFALFIVIKGMNAAKAAEEEAAQADRRGRGGADDRRV